MAGPRGDRLVPWAGLVVLGASPESGGELDRTPRLEDVHRPAGRALTGSTALALLLIGAAVTGSGTPLKPWRSGLWVWLLLPPLLLFAVSWVAMPLYVDRYFFAAARPRPAGRTRPGAGQTTRRGAPCWSAGSSRCPT